MLLTTIGAFYKIKQKNILQGGYSAVHEEFAESNNKYLNEKYDPKKETSYILSVDCNNEV